LSGHCNQNVICLFGSLPPVDFMDRKKTTTVKSQRDGDDQLLISVRDTGVVLPAEKADQIFDAFFTTFWIAAEEVKAPAAVT
jgi:hypothetical protein